MANPEQYHEGAERSQEISRSAAERSAELQKQHETGEQQKESHEEVAEARAEASKEAKKAAEHRTDQETEKPKQAFVASAERDRSYRQTMTDIQQQMPRTSRAFSKVIHNKTVEKVSDVIGSTVARPNAILSGAICAFVLVLGLYVHARYLGYALRGSETIAAFVAGWLIGLLFDMLRGMFRRKR